MDKEKRDTFEFLYKTHYKELYVHALSFVRDEEEAKDIVTDVYEYVWKNFENLYSSVSLRPFLYSLVRSRSLDFLRKEKTKEKFLAYKKTFPEEEEEYVEYEQLIEKVMHIIENMPKQTAVVFKKCFIERKKYKEAGDGSVAYNGGYQYIKRENIRSRIDVVICVFLKKIKNIVF